jgi:hypothetical protein
MIFIYLFVVTLAISAIIFYFANYKDERPDLGNFGGRKN